MLTIIYIEKIFYLIMHKPNVQSKLSRVHPGVRHRLRISDLLGEGDF